MSNGLSDAIDRAFEKAGYGDAQHDRDPVEEAEPEAQEPDKKAVAPEAPEEPEGVQEAPEPEGEAPEPEGEGEPEKDQEAEGEPEPEVEAAPARFDPTARADWAKAPASVRREVQRMERELTQGIEQHRQRVAEIEPFEKMAKEAGRKLPDVLASYVGMERLLRTDPVEGFTILAQQVGIEPKDLAAMLANPQEARRPARQPQQPQQDVSHVRSEIGELKREMEVRDKVAEIERWSKQPGRERFAEPNIATDMARFLESGIVHDLDGAYDMACRLHPAPKPKPAAVDKPVEPVEKPKPQGRASAKATAPRKASASIEDAVSKALSEVGF